METGGAWVLEVKLFSNVSVCFNFEIPINHTEQLREALATMDLHLTRESQDSFTSAREHKEPAAEHPQATVISGSLQITFIHNEPDLRIEVPRIPG
jgi:hypothetical protein